MSDSNVIDLYDGRFAPPQDPVFLYLLEQAVYGHVPVFGVVMSPSRLQRFDSTFNPENTPGGAAMVSQIMKRWNMGEPFQMWVYPRRKHCSANAWRAIRRRHSSRHRPY
jgi:hypothetical protein